MIEYDESEELSNALNLIANLKQKSKEDIPVLLESERAGSPKSTLQGNNHTVIIEEMREAIGSKMDALFASLTNGNVNISIYDKDQFNQSIRFRMADVRGAVNRLDQEVRKLGDTVKYTGD